MSHGALAMRYQYRACGSTVAGTRNPGDDGAAAPGSARLYHGRKIRRQLDQFVDKLLHVALAVAVVHEQVLACSQTTNVLGKVRRSGQAGVEQDRNDPNTVPERLRNLTANPVIWFQARPVPVASGAGQAVGSAGSAGAV